MNCYCFWNEIFFTIFFIFHAILIKIINLLLYIILLYNTNILFIFICSIINCYILYIFNFFLIIIKKNNRNLGPYYFNIFNLCLFKSWCDEWWLTIWVIILNLCHSDFIIIIAARQFLKQFIQGIFTVKTFIRILPFVIFHFT